MMGKTSKKNTKSKKRKTFSIRELIELSIVVAIGILATALPTSQAAFDGSGVHHPELRPVRFIPQLIKKVNLLKQLQTAHQVSLFFENLRTGQQFGTQENEEFDAASLGKVPLMIAILKASESKPELLDMRIQFLRETCEQVRNYQIIAPASVLEDRQFYSVDELLYRLIVHSDNTAICLLRSLATPEQTVNVLAAAGITLLSPSQSSWKISPKRYSGLLRILYNSTYLSPANSLKALQLLSRSAFHNGLSAGVPRNVPVSHKFGEWGLGKTEFHDCGIIYMPGSPYILCIMTEGENFERLIASVADLSRLIFDDISSPERIQPSAWTATKRN